MDIISNLGRHFNFRFPNGILGCVIIAFVIFIFCSACRYKDMDPIRNEITFTNSLVAVEDSLTKMVKLMSKLPSGDIVNYYIDKEGKFYVNNSNKGGLLTLSKESLIDDVEFTSFSVNDVFNFVSLVSYLEQNSIYSCQYEGVISQFRFGYRRPERESSVSLRDILIIDNDSLITDAFKEYFKVLDRKGSLVLISSN